MVNSVAVQDSKINPPKRAAERITDTARELFYRQGIRAVGVDEIVTQAGVTKPSLYRAYSSKDDLAAAYLRDYDAAFWTRLEEVMSQHPGDPRSGLLHYLRGTSERANRQGYRGCGLTNAAVEFPEADHPARSVAEDHKRRFRARLRQIAGAMGAREPDRLGDALMLLIEGVFASGQLFGEGGPAGALAEAAEVLMDAYGARPAGA